MTSVRQFRPGSDDRDAALSGRVLAERIGAVLAKPDTKAHQEYLRVVRDGEPEQGDEYRYSEDRWAAIGRALRLYRDRDETTVKAGRVYLHDELPLACCPHGVDAETIGMTVHVRQTADSYRDAVFRGVTPEDRKVAQASMAVTGLRYWSILNYTEAGELTDWIVKYDERRAGELLEAMLGFARAAGLEDARMQHLGRKAASVTAHTE